MKDMFKQIPQTMIKSLTPKQKVQKLMTDLHDALPILRLSTYTNTYGIDEDNHQVWLNRGP